LKKDNDNNSTDPSKPVGLRNVMALGLVSFFTDFSTEMVLGILPMFIVSSLGASRAALGAIEGSAELISYAFRMVSGSLSDKVGKRKIFILAGYGLSTISKPFLAITTTWQQAFLVRAGDRIGKGLRTAPRDALIADSVYESSSGKAFGLHRTIDQMGAIAGPIAAFALLQVMDIRGIFLISLIPGAIAVIILIFFVKEVAVKRFVNGTSIFSNIGGVIRGNRPFVSLLLITGIFNLGAYNFSFVLLRASDLGVREDFIPIVFAIINVAHAVTGIPSGMLADRVGKEEILVLGYTVFVISSIIMATLSGNSIYAYIIGTAFGVYIGISETVQRAVVPKYISSELRGTAFGIYNLILGTSFFASNIIFGYLWDSYNLNTAISYSLVLAVTSIVAMFVFIKKYPISNPEVS
jgi:MFS family permease